MKTLKIIIHCLFSFIFLYIGSNLFSENSLDKFDLAPVSFLKSENIIPVYDFTKKTPDRRKNFQGHGPTQSNLYKVTENGVDFFIKVFDVRDARVVNSSQRVRDEHINFLVQAVNEIKEEIKKESAFRKIDGTLASMEVVRFVNGQESGLAIKTPIIQGSRDFDLSKLESFDFMIDEKLSSWAKKYIRENLNESLNLFPEKGKMTLLGDVSSNGLGGKDEVNEDNYIRNGDTIVNVDPVNMEGVLDLIAMKNFNVRIRPYLSHLIGAQNNQFSMFLFEIAKNYGEIDSSFAATNIFRKVEEFFFDQSGAVDYRRLRGELVLSKVPLNLLLAKFAEVIMSHYRMETLIIEKGGKRLTINYKDAGARKKTISFNLPKKAGLGITEKQLDKTKDKELLNNIILSIVNSELENISDKSQIAFVKEAPTPRFSQLVKLIERFNLLGDSKLKAKLFKALKIGENVLPVVNRDFTETSSGSYKTLALAA